MSELDWLEDFSDCLKDMMRKRDISGRKLAREIGVSHSTISRYMDGKLIPSSVTLFNIANVLECRITDLCFIDEMITK